MDDLVAAVRQLRENLGLSQQAFATKLNLSISAIANYERDRRPTGKALLELQNLSNANRLYDLAALFRDAFSKEVGYSVMQVPPDPAAKLAVLSEVRRRVNAGDTDQQIIDVFPAWPDLVALFIDNFRALDQDAQTSRKAKKR